MDTQAAEEIPHAPDDRRRRAWQGVGMNRKQEDAAADLKALMAGKSFLRTALAFLLFMRALNSTKIETCYEVADEFIAHLEDDLRNCA
jgi:hypothetical protein